MFSLNKRIISSDNNEENPYTMSFSDMMAGMLIIFILVCSTLIYQLQDKRIKINDELKKLIETIHIRDEMLLEIKSKLKELNINVQIDEDSLIIPITEIGFDSGSDKILPQYKWKAIALGQTLCDVFEKNNRWKKLETVFIEGHTDSKNYYGLKGNWGLSTFRAISLWEFWIDSDECKQFGYKLKNMRVENQSNKIISLFSVSGYADTRKIIENEQEEKDFARNRRINIRFVMQQIHPSDLKKIIDSAF